MQDEGVPSKLHRATSFNKKNSMVRMKEGEEQRPDISRGKSVEEMTEKIYALMSSYIPKDVPVIQRQYFFSHTGL